jgi:hypothetical protein
MTRTRDSRDPEPGGDRATRVLASRASLGRRNDRPVARRRAGFSRAESVENRETDAGRLRAVPGSATGCLPERRAEMRAGRATPEMQEIAAILKTVVCVFMPVSARGGRARRIANKPLRRRGFGRGAASSVLIRPRDFEWQRHSRRTNSHRFWNFSKQQRGAPFFAKPHCSLFFEREKART